MLKSIGCSSDVVISGFLHDIIEDTSYGYNYLKDNFGKVIADNVLSVSEDLSIKDWIKRKEEFIKRLSGSSIDIIMIELADKLHNLVSDYDLWKENKYEALKTLNTTYEMNKWYYSKMRDIFNKNISSDNLLLKRYNEICDIYFK